MAFINYVKAYTSVEIIAVLEPSQHKGVHERCVGILANIKKIHCYPDSTQNEQKKKIMFKNGFRQGDNISPMFFMPRAGHTSV